MAFSPLPQRVNCAPSGYQEKSSRAGQARKQKQYEKCYSFSEGGISGEPVAPHKKGGG